MLVTTNMFVPAVLGTANEKKAGVSWRIFK